MADSKLEILLKVQGDEAKRDIDSVNNSMRAVGTAAQDAASAASGAMNDLREKVTSVADAANSINFAQALGSAQKLLGLGGQIYSLLNDGAQLGDTMVGGALGGGLSGASALSMFGPLGMLIGGIGGSAMGAFGSYLKDQKAQEQQAEAERQLADATNARIASILEEEKRLEGLAYIQEKLSDASSESADREKMRAQLLEKVNERLDENTRLLGQFDAATDGQEEAERLLDERRKLQQRKRTIEAVRIEPDTQEATEEESPARAIQRALHNFGKQTDAMGNAGLNIGAFVERDNKTVQEISTTAKAIEKGVQKVADELKGAMKGDTVAVFA